MPSRTNPGKPSKHQIRKYAILMVLSETTEPLTISELETATGFAVKDIFETTQYLTSWSDIKGVKIDGARRFSIQKKGISKIKYFKENMDYHKYWKPPWEGGGGFLSKK